MRIYNIPVIKSTCEYKLNKDLSDSLLENIIYTSHIAYMTKHTIQLFL